MKIRKFIWFLITLFTLSVCFQPFVVEASAAKKKTSISQSSKKKTSTKKNAKRTSTKSRKSSSRTSKGSKGSKKKTTKKQRRNVASSSYQAPPKEQPSNDSLTLRVNSALLDRIPSHLNPGGLRVNSVKPDPRNRYAVVSLNENFTYLPITRGFIDTLQTVVKASLPDSIASYRVMLNVGNRGLSYYITKVDKLPEEHRKNPPFVKEANPLIHPSKGMENDIVALWHSHGRYFKNGSWQWQRPLLFQTVEDTYTMGYILPFVVPMMENAGAYVMLPRERDTNNVEVIVDNDTNEEGQIFSQPHYREKSGVNPWITGEEEGFIYDLPDFRDTENPFENGTYRQTSTTRNKNRQSFAAWYADIPRDGEYAVYVSYKTLPNSTSDARYTVNYSGGSKEFIVNQKMGGGTWIYLGTFPLEEGFSDSEPIVTLSNLTSGTEGSIVTADALKIGGGMGNIARSPRRSDVWYDPSTPYDPEEDDEETDAFEEDTDEDTRSDDTFDNADSPTSQSSSPSIPSSTSKGPAPVFRTSGMPRFLEGARYWLHWAGFPEYVYSPYHGCDDYKDDYTSRGHWVNYLVGGSRVLPNADGLNIPVDAVLALHSDAGKRADDSFVGTLGIYFTQNGASYRDGTPRINSRMLTDMVMQQITADVRREFEPRWTRRSMWDKSYVEARVPEVPTTLIELMSHQNFADMQYGLDPTFRFTVGRAIYKAMARFLAQRKDRKLVIQPLPVQDFAIRPLKKGSYRLEWHPTPDPLEPSAIPSSYIIMERTGNDLGFHKIGETNSTHYDLRVVDDEIHSFRIIAVNEGGASFPSETLALRQPPAGQQPMLIINGFSRVSGPAHFSEGDNAGFKSEEDFGVPYISDISFTGYQTEFRRSAGESFGRSGANYASQVIAGNTFDFAAVHGKAISSLGHGFISASASAVESGMINLEDFTVVDLILGKQKRTVVGNGKSGIRYQAFPPQLRDALRKFSDGGGRLIISGQYVASELFDLRGSKADRDFARDVIGIDEGSVDRSKSGRVRLPSGKTLDYSANLNSRQYIVESPDILVPADNADTSIALTFGSTGEVAGLNHHRRKGIVTTFSIPLEALSEPDDLVALLKSINL